MPDGHHEVGAEEDGELADVDDLVVVDVADRLEHDEQHVVVDVELGPLVCLDGVLDGQRRQVELGGDRGQIGLARLLQPDPHEARRPASNVAGLPKRQAPRPATPVLIDGAVADDVIRAASGGSVGILCRTAT